MTDVPTQPEDPWKANRLGHGQWQIADRCMRAARELTGAIEDLESRTVWQVREWLEGHNEDAPEWRDCVLGVLERQRERPSQDESVEYWPVEALIRVHADLPMDGNLTKLQEHRALDVVLLVLGPVGKIALLGTPMARDTVEWFYATLYRRHYNTFRGERKNIDDILQNAFRRLECALRHNRVRHIPASALFNTYIHWTRLTLHRRITAANAHVVHGLVLETMPNNFDLDGQILNQESMTFLLETFSEDPYLQYFVERYLLGRTCPEIIRIHELTVTANNMRQRLYHLRQRMQCALENEQGGD